MCALTRTQAKLASDHTQDYSYRSQTFLLITGKYDNPMRASDHKQIYIAGDIEKNLNITKFYILY